MSARERIALRGDVINIRVGMNGFQTFDSRIIKIRSPPKSDIFQHRVNDDSDHDIGSDKPGGLLIQTPVKKADDRDHDHLLAEHRKKGSRRGCRCPHISLDHLHEFHFPRVVENRSFHKYLSSLSDHPFFILPSKDCKFHTAQQGRFLL